MSWRHFCSHSLSLARLLLRCRRSRSDSGSIRRRFIASIGQRLFRKQTKKRARAPPLLGVRTRALITAEGERLCLRTHSERAYFGREKERNFQVLLLTEKAVGVGGANDAVQIAY